MEKKEQIYAMNYNEENLYKNEVENLIKYYLNNELEVNPGTTLEEGIVALKLIDDMRTM